MYQTFDNRYLNRRYFLILLWGIATIFLTQSCSEAPDPVGEKTEEKVVRDENSDVFPDAKYLVEADQLSELLKNEELDLAIIEISKSTLFDEGHIHGAINLWRDDYGSSDESEYEGMRASKHEIEVLLSRLGILPTTTIAVYDTKGSVDAIRFIWMLEIYGHENILLLNGGKTAWEKAGFELDDETSPSRPLSKYVFNATPDFTYLATIEDVKSAINDTNIIILDTREPEEFLGQPYINKGKLNLYKKGAFTYGNIPGAIHLNWSAMVSLNDDHRFYKMSRLKRTLQEKGISPEKQIITYCQSGVRSMHTTYVLRDLLGYPNVKNYDGSWIEWSYYHTKDGSVPIERHTEDQAFEEMRKELEIELTK